MDSDSEALDVHTFETPEDSAFRDFYPVNPPYGYVGIVVEEGTGRLLYRAVEPSMEENEQWILKEIKDSIIERMDIPVSLLDDREKMDSYLKEQADEVFQRLKKKVAIESEAKYLYYLKRDFLGYGKLDLLMLDPKIEDISCNGLDTPIYVWHREFESIPTNVIYSSDQELNRIVTRLAYKTGHQISIARPLVEGTLPEGHRVQLTLEEVSKEEKHLQFVNFGITPLQ